MTMRLSCRCRHVELTRSGIGFAGFGERHRLGDEAAGRGSGLVSDRHRFAWDVGASYGATASPNMPRLQILMKNE
uniref:Uncharacterized protein n=1 Tax=Oryza meridionalis TaxID=40149 RepID=A0A0E0CNG5_9ORYZ